MGNISGTLFPSAHSTAMVFSLPSFLPQVDRVIIGPMRHVVYLQVAFSGEGSPTDVANKRLFACVLQLMDLKGASR